jgi:hypothetical protein
MQITTIGLDLAKNVFQIHGVDATDQVVNGFRSIFASPRPHSITFGNAARKVNYNVSRLIVLRPCRIPGGRQGAPQTRGSFVSSLSTWSAVLCGLVRCRTGTRSLCWRCVLVSTRLVSALRRWSSLPRRIRLTWSRALTSGRRGLVLLCGRVGRLAGVLARRLARRVLLARLLVAGLALTALSLAGLSLTRRRGLGAGRLRLADALVRLLA